MTAPVILAVDGNSLVHRSFHAQGHSAYRRADGRQAWAVRGLLGQLAAAADRACADAIVVGFDDPSASVRRERWPHYKAQRRPKLPGLEAQLELAVELTRDLGLAVIVPEGLEADDVLASVAAYAPTIGGRTVLVTSDRDAFALVDEHTRLLRIINGGVEASPMLDPNRARMVVGVRPDQYRDLAALRGDPSDNLPGVRGVGPAKGALLLGEFGTAAAAFDDAAAGGERCRQLVGAALTATLAAPESRHRWQENCAVMSMHTDVPIALGLDVPPGDPHQPTDAAAPARPAGRLPLSPSAIADVFGSLDLGVPNALRALAGIEPSAPTQPSATYAHVPRRPHPDDVDPTWRPPPRRATTRHAPLRRSAPATPTHVQGRLF